MAHKDEDSSEVSEISIKILDGGGFLYTVRSRPPKSSKGNMPSWTEPKEYAAQSVEEIMEFLKDDLESPHMKKEGARGMGRLKKSKKEAY